MDDVDEIVQEFLVESHENLDQLDRDLVALEQEPDARELLSSVFRTIHTIKGTCGFLAFSRLEAVAHVGENLLSQLRDGVRRMDPDTTSLLLSMVDVVRALLTAIEETGGEGDVQVDDVVAAIGALLAAPAGAASSAASSTAPAPADEPAATTPETPAKTPARTGSAKSATRRRAPSTGPAPVQAAVPEVPEVPEVQHPAAPTTSGAVTKLGDVLIESGAASPHDVAAAVALQQQGDSRALGEILVAEGAVEPAVMAEAMNRRQRIGENSIRVDVDLLDALMRQVGELVLTRNQIVQYASAQHDVTLLRTSQRLNLIASELQEGVMKTRMQPIDHIWSKLPRVVRDLALNCGKQVHLDMHGRETELDRTLLDAVKDPLTHLVRNAIDHGIEDPAGRVAAGKPPEGVLKLRAFHEGGHVIVEVRDDGAGIDPARIGAKAVERGIVTADEFARMTTDEVLALVFRAGFSTAEKVTNVSGRGVGMDVVRTNIEKIGGTVGVESHLGEGTTWRLTIPLTLAIAQVLTIECAGDRYAIPQATVQELVSLNEQSVEYVSGVPVYRLRGRLLPLVGLADVLGLQEDATTRGCIVVVSLETRSLGLVVDRVLTTEEIVVKPLSSRLKGIGVYAGATILGDGTVALILDVAALARRSLPAAELATRAAANGEVQGERAKDSDRLLLVGVGGHRLAIPLDRVTRLERFRAADVERVGSREVIQYRNEILPVARLAQLLGAYGETESENLHAIVHTERGRSVALVVDEIFDVVEADLVRSDLDDTGIIGSAVVQQKVTELLDVRAAVLSADPRFYGDHDDLSYRDLEVGV